MLISKSDINVFYKFTENIRDAEINPYINDAEIFDVQPLLPTGMYAAIVAQLPKPQIAWDRNTAYVTNNVIFHIDRYYKCVTGNTASEPTAVNANWASAELLNFWLSYIKPYQIYNALYRFVLEHGMNLTQYGIRQLNEDTSQEISDKRRAEMRLNMQSKANHYLGLYNAQFKLVAGVFDGTTYAYDVLEKRVKAKFGLFQQGCSDKKPRRDFYNGEGMYGDEYNNY